MRRETENFQISAIYPKETHFACFYDLSWNNPLMGVS